MCIIINVLSIKSIVVVSDRTVVSKQISIMVGTFSFFFQGIYLSTRTYLMVSQNSQMENHVRR